MLTVTESADSPAIVGDAYQRNFHVDGASGDIFAHPRIPLVGSEWTAPDGSVWLAESVRLDFGAPIVVTVAYRRHKANFASIKLDDNPPPLTPEDMATWIPIGDTSTDEDGFPLDPEA